MACKQAIDKNKRLDSYYPVIICFMSHASSLKGASINQSAYESQPAVPMLNWQPGQQQQLIKYGLHTADCVYIYKYRLL